MLLFVVMPLGPEQRCASEAEGDLACIARNLDFDTTLAVGSDGLRNIQLSHWNSATLLAHLYVKVIRRQHVSMRFQTISVGHNKECRRSRL